MCLLSECLSNSHLFWHTGNFAAKKIVATGTSIPELQTKDIEDFLRLHMKIVKLKIHFALVQKAMGKLIECDQ